MPCQWTVVGSVDRFTTSMLVGSPRLSTSTGPGNSIESRSEEHTSELQSLAYLVCRLLLDPATPALYTLSLHDALPIWPDGGRRPIRRAAPTGDAVIVALEFDAMPMDRRGLGGPVYYLDARRLAAPEHQHRPRKLDRIKIGRAHV